MSRFTEVSTLIQARNIDLGTCVYYNYIGDFDGPTTETSKGTIELPAGRYIIGVCGHVGTGGSSASNYSADLKARLGSASGTQVAFASYYLWLSNGVKQDIGVGLFNTGEATLNSTTTVHITAYRSGNLSKFQRCALFAIRIG